MQYPKKLIKEIYRSLPDEISEIIDSETTLDTIAELRKQFNLNQNQVNSLGNELTLFLIGITARDNLDREVQTSLSVAPDIASKLVTELYKLVILKIPPQILRAQFEYAQVKLHQLSSDNPQKALTDSKNISEPPSNLPAVEETEPVPMVVPKKETTYQSTINKLFVRPTTPAQDSPKETPTPNPSVLSEPKLEPKPKMEEKMPEAPKISYPNNKDPYREPLE